MKSPQRPEPSLQTPVFFFFFLRFMRRKEDKVPDGKILLVSNKVLILISKSKKIHINFFLKLKKQLNLDLFFYVYKQTASADFLLNYSIFFS